MSGRRRITLATAALWLAMAPRGVVAQEVPQGFAIGSRVDRPATWVADRVMFVVDVTCPKGFDILTEDLDRQKLKTVALDVLGGDSSRREDGDVVRYQFRYALTTYRVDAPVLSIAPFSVRYYATSGGQRPDQLSPAGSLQVPGARVTFRSLLPDDQVSSPVRDDWQLPPRRARYRLLGLAGAGLMALALVPAALSLSALVRRAGARRLRDRKTARQVRRTGRAAVDELRSREVSDANARTAAFAALEGAVRQHLIDAYGVAAGGMTPEELGPALAAADAEPIADAVIGVFETCELARYAPPDRRPSADDWRTALEASERILSGPR